MATQPQRIASEYNWKIRQVKGTIAIVRNLALQGGVNKKSLDLLTDLEQSIISTFERTRDQQIAQVKEWEEYYGDS